MHCLTRLPSWHKNSAWLFFLFNELREWSSNKWIVRPHSRYHLVTGTAGTPTAGGWGWHMPGRAHRWSVSCATSVPCMQSCTANQASHQRLKTLFVPRFIRFSHWYRADHSPLGQGSLFFIIQVFLFVKRQQLIPDISPYIYILYSKMST